MRWTVVRWTVRSRHPPTAQRRRHGRRAVAYPDLLRRHIPGSEDTLFIAGLPFGRPKTGSQVNQFQPARLPVDEWFKIVG